MLTPIEEQNPRNRGLSSPFHFLSFKFPTFYRCGGVGAWGVCECDTSVTLFYVLRKTVNPLRVGDPYTKENSQRKGSLSVVHSRKYPEMFRTKLYVQSLFDETTYPEPNLK